MVDWIKDIPDKGGLIDEPGGIGGLTDGPADIDIGIGGLITGGAPEEAMGVD